MMMRNTWTANMSSADYEELRRRQAERGWDVKPRRYRAKNASANLRTAKQQPRPFNLDDPVDLELYRFALAAQLALLS